MTTPVPTTVVVYPSWWATAATVTLTDIREATATFAPADAEFFPWGVSFPDSVLGQHVFIPWNQVQGISASL